MTGRILLVDDDPTLLRALTYALKRELYDVVSATTGTEALEAARTRDVDLVVLDLMLPDVQGSDVCRSIRDESTVPIIMLTAKDSELDKVLGLALGADDYVTKPFSIKELIGRIRAQLRRRELDREESRAAIRRLGALHVDFGRHEVHVEGREVQLTPSEFKVLYLLAETPGQVFSRRDIMQHLWDSAFVGDEHACDIHISNLRRKLERDPSRPERIVTVRGFGYKLVPN
jgi:DNA-binding response OmpR family regulator